MDPSKTASSGANLAVINGHRLPKPAAKGYCFGNLLGKGTYGYVFRANKFVRFVSVLFESNSVFLNFQGSRQPVAIKCVLLNSLSANSQNNLINEIEILKRIQHKFIVQLIDFQWDKSYVYMILEFCPGGELATIIRLKRSFPEDIVQHFLQQLASALQFLREHNVSHMDLKPQNILITGISFLNLLNELNTFKVWRNVILKIADFGFAQYLDKDQLASSIRGSPRYMAPEILLGQPYDASVDLWSIGVILYECLFSTSPYDCSSTEKMMKRFSKNQIQITLPTSHRLSENCAELLLSLLQIDPERRISFEHFFHHPFIDLEHMPSAESYDKAQVILSAGLAEDKGNNFKSAFYHYRDALSYLLPLNKWGDPVKPFSVAKQDSLKATVVRYIERAEQLKSKCDFIDMDGKRLKTIENIYNLIDLAREQCSDGRLEHSMATYERAIEMALTVIKTCDQKAREEFFSSINDWFTEAETVKQRLQSRLVNEPGPSTDRTGRMGAKIEAYRNRKLPTSHSMNSDPNCFVQ